MKSRNVICVVLAFMAIFAWICTLFLARQAGAFMGAFDLRFGAEGGSSPADVVRAERYAAEDGRENPPQQTIWREEKGQIATDGEGERTASLTLLTCFGNGDDLYPATFRFGAMPIRGDAEGIVLDTAAANSLWGGIGAMGQTVLMGGKAYTLRGVFEGERGVALVQDSADSETRYPNLLQQGGERPAGALDLPFLSWLLSALAGLPGVVLMLALLLRILRRGWMLRYSPILLTQYILPAMLGGILTLWAGGFPWQIPAKAIPTRFSDLDFWGKLAEEIGNGITGILTGSMTVRDLALWTPALWVVLLVPIACALTIAAARGIQIKQLNELLVGGLVAMFVAFATSAWLGVEPGRTLLSLPTLWLAADLTLCCHTELLKPKCHVEQRLAPVGKEGELC